MSTLTSERVFRMKKNFISLHEQGYSIPEIAKINNLSFVTVYRHLQEIADENGVAREELLKVIRVRKNGRSFSGSDERIRIDIAALENSFEEAIRSVDDVISKVEDVLKTAREAKGSC